MTSLRDTRRQHWFPAYVALGSNLDDPESQVRASFDALDAISDTRLIARSSLYRSAPVGGVEQPDFINAAVALLTLLPAEVLLRDLQRIENERGRKRGGVRWGPRILDLDLLVYSNQIIETGYLTVPHPRIAERNFVLLPLGEIAPKLNIPGLGPIESLDAASIDSPISTIENPPTG